MNALQRDLKRLVPMVEAAGAARVAADPHRQKLHVQPTGCARSAMNTMYFISTARLTPREGSSTGGTCAAAICSTGNACP